MVVRPISMRMPILNTLLSHYKPGHCRFRAASRQRPYVCCQETAGPDSCEAERTLHIGYGRLAAENGCHLRNVSPCVNDVAEWEGTRQSF